MLAQELSSALFPARGGRSDTGTRARCAVAALLSLALALAGAGSAAAEDANARGAALFELCTACHGSAAGGRQEYGAPAIAGLPQWYIQAQLEKFKGGIRGTHPDDYAGMRMRPMSMTLTTDEDLQAVAAYVAALPASAPEPVLNGGDAERGRQFYTPCIACHGPTGAGNQALFSPPIADASDWYLLEQLKKFKAGIRGANPQDTSGALMRPMSMTLPDEQAMKDVIAHIMTLEPQQSQQ